MILEKLRKSDIEELKSSIPYSELDKNIVKLVKAVNSFDEIYTVGSCGGHENNKPYQLPFGNWNVLFRIENPEIGLISLEFLVWFFNSSLRRNGFETNVYPISPPPYLNGLGESLYFVLEGADVSADEIADELKKAKKEFYKKII